MIIPVWSLNPHKLQSQLLRVKPQELWCCGCQPCGLHPCWLFLYALNRTAQGSEASWLKHHCPPFLWELDCSLGWDWIGDHFISQCPDRPLPLTQSSSCRFICGCYFCSLSIPVSLVKESGNHALQGQTYNWKKQSISVPFSFTWF